MQRRAAIPAVQRSSIDALTVPRTDSAPALQAAVQAPRIRTAWASYSDRDAVPAGLRLRSVPEAQGAATAARPEGIARPLPMANRSRLAAVYGPVGVPASMLTGESIVNDCSHNHAWVNTSFSADVQHQMCHRCGSVRTLKMVAQ